MARGRVVLFLLLAVSSTAAAYGDVVLVTRSAATNGAAILTDIDSIPSLSWDGRFVAYAADAADLAPGQVDANGKMDVFLYDRATNTNTLVSHAFDSATTAADNASTFAQVSADGNYVLFGSSARNLVPSFGGGGASHLYLYDRRANSVRLISHKADSATTAGDFASEPGYPAISGDGRYVAYATRSADYVAGIRKSPAVRDVFLYDRVTDRSVLVSHQSGDPLLATGGDSAGAAINLDGTVVAFGSWSPTVIAGIADTNGTDDLFLYDIASGALQLVTTAAGNPAQTANKRSYSPMLDASGMTLSYESTSTNLVDGQVDTNNNSDAFLFDRVTGRNMLVSHVPDRPATTGARASYRPMISTDGKIVVFNSNSADLYGRSGNDLHVYRYDCRTNAVSLITYAAGSTVAADEPAATFSMSGDGRRIAINSGASNLVIAQADRNGLGDAFVWDADTASMFVVSTIPGSSKQTGNGHTLSTWISGDGSTGVFASLANDLASPDSNDAEDLFLWHKPRQQGRRRVLAH